MLTDDAVDLIKAFPRSVQEDTRAVLELLPPGQLAPASPFMVNVDGDELVIPYRIYNGEPPAAALAALPATRAAILSCLLTRHCDGFVRQRHLQHIIRRPEPWIVPFVVQLVGEYVLEIINVIAGALDLTTPTSADGQRLGHFVVENPQYFERVARRASRRQLLERHYRAEYPTLNRNDTRFPPYPGFVLIDWRRAAARWSLTRDTSPVQDGPSS